MAAPSAGVPRLTDRRIIRLTLDACASCGTPNPTVTVRTPYVLYLRCRTCFAMWSQEKPRRLRRAV